ncbi:MAG: DUF4136 domain-containing protein [Planctomycetota bacterium]|nr:DUF4136 domain-containing protein [Planctomycetota bacterium]
MGLVAIAVGCVSGGDAEPPLELAVASSRNPSTRVPRGARYALVRGPSGLDTYLSAQRVDFDGLVQKALHDALRQRGYVASTPGASDILVGYTLVVDRVVDSAAVNAQFGLHDGWRPDSAQASSFDKGTLVLDMFTPARRSIWRGEVQGRIHWDLEPEVRERRLRRAVEALLRWLP